MHTFILSYLFSLTIKCSNKHTTKHKTTEFLPQLIFQSINDHFLENNETFSSVHFRNKPYCIV